MRIATWCLIISTVVAAVLYDARGADDADRTQPSGRIGGRVIDGLTKTPVAGASVLVDGAGHGAATDDNGEFALPNLDVGAYSVTVSSVGYAAVTYPDVIVRPGRVTRLQIELHQVAREIEGTVVRGSYFNDNPSEPTSSTGFSGEEVRRSPGSAGDISRAVNILPSIAKINDQLNSLVVRGGTPTENGFYLDNIEIPNINHYPVIGSSGGPIGLLNVDFIRDVDFSAGGFSAAYGDRLSSIMNIEFREGNREEFDGQIDLNFAGFGGAFEGPIAHGRGSWMFSARRSFLDLLVDAIGTGVAPRYSDYQGKAVFDLSRAHQLSLLGVAGFDYIDFSSEDSQFGNSSILGKWDSWEYAVGLNWRALWGPRFHSNTSLGLLTTRYRGSFQWTRSLEQRLEENSRERSLQLRNVNVYQAGRLGWAEFGVEVKRITNNYDIFLDDYWTPYGAHVPMFDVDREVTTHSIGLFASWTAQPTASLSSTFGLRWDHFQYNDRSHLSPRFAASYSLSESTSLHFATGIYYQSLPLGLLVRDSTFPGLKDMTAYQYVLGVTQMLSTSTRLTVETYYKGYENFPMDPAQPETFMIDEWTFADFYSHAEVVVDNGRARSYGVEAVVQKKLVEGIYGLFSAAWYQARYRGLDLVWRDRLLDNRVIFGVEGGYKPNNRWELSARWVFAGGRPYTPLDLTESARHNRAVWDLDRINAERYSDYHTLNLRIDRRFYWRNSGLVVYLSVWNVYNRDNVYKTYWNTAKSKEETVYQWSIVPVFGLEFEF